MRKHLKFLILILIVAAIFTQGCSNFVKSRKGIEKCDFEIQSAKLGRLTLKGVNLKLKINITNPNNLKVIVDRFDYEVFANGKFLAAGSNKDKFEIASNETYLLKTNVFLGYNNLGGFVKQLVKKDKVKYEVKGTVYIKTPLGTINYPVSITKIENR